MLSRTAKDPKSKDDERSLVARAIRGDRAAQDMMFNLHAPGIYRLAFRMTGDGDLAGDMTQADAETAVVRWEYRPVSTVFFVWTQERDGSAAYGDFNFTRDKVGFVS